MGHVEQQLPVATDGPHMHDLVAADVRQLNSPATSSGLWLRVVSRLSDDLAGRKQIGIERYGQPLQAHNGRDAMRDAYEEALDLLVYLKQVTVESQDGFLVYKAAVVLVCELAVLRERLEGEG